MTPERLVKTITSYLCSENTQSTFVVDELDILFDPSTRSGDFFLQKHLKNSRTSLTQTYSHFDTTAYDKGVATAHYILRTYGIEFPPVTGDDIRRYYTLIDIFTKTFDANLLSEEFQSLLKHESPLIWEIIEVAVPEQSHDFLRGILDMTAPLQFALGRIESYN